MPIRNEAAHLHTAVASILAQEYPLPFDICLAVGPSDDDTEAIAEAIASNEPRVKVVASPTGKTPAGLNLAIAATDGQVVVRVDGHSVLSPGYIRQAAETMRATGAVNVGGVQAAMGSTDFENAVARVMTSRLGTGGAKFHVGGQAGPVDTVYLGVFSRAAGDAVGWFDESLVRNQDYELNIRLRRAGGVVWFDPDLSVEYRPRSTVRSLVKQYYQYGYWKAQVAKKWPRSLKPRQVAPPVALMFGVGVAAALWRFPRARRALMLTAATASPAVAIGLYVRPTAAVIAPVMHLSWAIGFWVGVLRPRRERVVSNR